MLQRQFTLAGAATWRTKITENSYYNVEVPKLDHVTYTNEIAWDPDHFAQMHWKLGAVARRA